MYRRGMGALSVDEAREKLAQAVLTGNSNWIGQAIGELNEALLAAASSGTKTADQAQTQPQLPAPPPSTSVAPPTFGLLNRTQNKDFTGGGVFQIGDQYSAMVSNVAKNKPVSVTASQDGRSLGTSVVGNTGDAGLFELRGTMDKNTVGSWDEVWSVPGGYYSDYLPNLAPLSAHVAFSVAAAPVVTPSGDKVINSSGAQDAPKNAPTPVVVPSWFTESMIGGVPNWALALAGVALVLFGGKR